MQRPRASVIISSYNYAPYLRQAIDSALAQTASAMTEVIVVDDGSSDESPQIIESYGDRVIPLLKKNGGQASSLNAGFRISRGDIILFLDSDDALLPQAVERACGLLHSGNGNGNGNGNVCKAHWQLIEFGMSGQLTGNLIPGAELSLGRGDIRDEVVRHGPRTSLHEWPPTSGNAFARRYLEQVMPIPESRYVTCPDAYLCGIAPLYGTVALSEEPLSMWRLHGSNNTYRDEFSRRIGKYVRLWDDVCDDVADHAARHGLPSDAQHWKADSWWRQIERSIVDLRRVLPPQAPFILMDGSEWSCAELDGRRAMALFERDGISQGDPSDDASALAELEAQLRRGARTAVFAWPCFWYLKHYHSFAERLRSSCKCLLDNDRLVVFDLEGYPRG